MGNSERRLNQIKRLLKPGGKFIKVYLTYTLDDKIAEKKAEACVRRGLEILGRSIARHGDEVYCNGKKAGVVTSGSMSPTFGKAICMARIAREFSQEESFTVVVRGKESEAKRTPLPFYKREK